MGSGLVSKTCKFLCLSFKLSREANSAISGVIWPKFKLIQDIIVVLVVKNDENPIKNEGTRVLTTLKINFSNCQGQLTAQSVMGSGPNFNSSEILWLSLLPASMKKTGYKIAEKMC